MGRSENRRLRKQGLSLTEIAKHVGLHRNTVARLLKEPPTKVYTRAARADAATPYDASIREWMKEQMPVERMLQLVASDCQNPYTGSRSAFFAGVARIRAAVDAAKVDAYSRFEGLPGEYAQVDWGEVRGFPFKRQDRSTRYFLSVRLKFSRVSFVKWTDSMRLEVVIRGLLEACEYFGGVPWVFVFDNMKTVTLGRDEHNQPIWHPVFLKFAEELDFKPEACDRGCPNQKGSVENLVGWVKSSFLQGRSFQDDADLAQQNKGWLEFVNESRPSRAHGEIPFSLLPEEQAAFTPLKENAEKYGLFSLVIPNREGRVYLAGKRYQAPIGYAGKTLAMRVRRAVVEFYDGDRQVATYPRCSDGQSDLLFEPEHLEALFKQRPRARIMVYRDYLMQQVPPISNYVVGVCSRHRGDAKYGPHVLRLFQLLREQGPDALAAACTLAGELKAFGVEYLEQILGLPAPPLRVRETLELPGLPSQAETDRGLATYEAYAVVAGEHV